MKQPKMIITNWYIDPKIIKFNEVKKQHLVLLEQKKSWKYQLFSPVSKSQIKLLPIRGSNNIFMLLKIWIDLLNRETYLLIWIIFKIIWTIQR